VAQLDREIDRLFEVPLDEFTSKRNELVRTLKQAGEKEAAEQVQALSKPSVPAWTMNQLARQEKTAVKALLEAGAKLRKAQQEALRGGGKSGDVLRAAQTEEREALRDLSRRAAAILENAGRPASRAMLDRISASLRAAAVTEGGRSALKAGRLSGEPEASGFEALAGFELPAGRPTATPRDELAERRRRKAELERRRRELDKNARELAQRADRAERDAERAEAAAAEARRTAEEARREADAAAAELASFDDAS
jgi:hypothetical protein